MLYLSFIDGLIDSVALYNMGILIPLGIGFAIGLVIIFIFWIFQSRK